MVNLCILNKIKYHNLFLSLLLVYAKHAILLFWHPWPLKIKMWKSDYGDLPPNAAPKVENMHLGMEELISPSFPIL